MWTWATAARPSAFSFYINDEIVLMMTLTSEYTRKLTPAILIEIMH